MRLISLTPMRNEAWVAEYSLRALLEWCDEACVLCHACEDETVAVVDRLRVETGRVHAAIEPDPACREQDHRQRLLEMGRRLGGTHFALVDADEVLSADWLPSIRGRVEALDVGQLLGVPWVDLWRSLDEYRVDRCGTAPLAFCDKPSLEHRAHPDGYPLHMRAPWPISVPSRQHDPRLGGLMHLQRASWRRAEARQARYKVQEMVEWPFHRGGPHRVDARYSKSIDEAGLVLAPVPAGWWAYPHDRGLVDLDAEPWEAADMERMLAEHAHEPHLFRGLRLGR